MKSMQKRMKMKIMSSEKRLQKLISKPFDIQNTLLLTTKL